MPRRWARPWASWRRSAAASRRVPGAGPRSPSGLLDRRGLGPRGLAAGDLGDARQGDGPQHRAHVLADLGPDGQQDALALVVAGTVLVGLAEVTVTGGEDETLSETSLVINVLPAPTPTP